MHLHVLYESDGAGKAHGCAWIRLLNPLRHPSLGGRVRITTGEDWPESTPDAVIVERNYRPNFSIEDAEALVEQARARGVPLIHTSDDNLLDLNTGPSIWHFPRDEQRHVLRYLMRAAHGLIVSTEPLARRLRALNPRIEVVPNQIDEQLFRRRSTEASSPSAPLVMGYMGTPTHLDDLLMILNPLREFLQKFAGQVLFETLGVADAHMLREMFAEGTVRHLSVPRPKADYPEFARWMDANIHWDFAIAPLSDSDFASCKSDLKILDYGILGIPGIFSDVTSYRSSIRHGENGLLTENSAGAWGAALAHMATQHTQRQAMAQCIEQEIWQHRTLATQAVQWEQAIERLIA